MKESHLLGGFQVPLVKHLQQAEHDVLIINHLKLPGAPQAFCPETEPLSEGLFPSSEVFIQHFDTLLCKTKIDEKSHKLSIWSCLGL